MKKSNLITGILYVLFGVVCLIVALLIETKLEGILWGFAGAGIFPGIMMICKYFYWSSPKNKEQYEELWGDRIFEKCGIRRDEGGDGGKTLEIRGKRRLSARDGGANYQQS